MTLKPLIQIREIIENALTWTTKSNKSSHKFFTEAMQLYLTIQGHVNFSQMARFGQSSEGRFRDDIRLNDFYTGPKTHRRGRPHKFSGRVNIKELDMTVFNTMHIADGNKATDAFWADVWSLSLERKVRVVILDCLEDGKKTQKRKVFFSTDTSLEPMDIINIYTSRFQIEFLFRDSKQFMGLTHYQARSKEAMNFAFNMSLTSINVACEFARQNKMDLSIASIKTLLHNAAMLERLISMLGKTPNIKLNNTYFKELLFYGVRNAA